MTHPALSRLSQLLEYVEDQHPRDKTGRWTSGNAGAAVDSTRLSLSRDKSSTGTAVAKKSLASKVDWDKSDLAAVAAVTDKVAADGGKTDICLVNPPLCQGSLGIERAEMPQLTKEASEAMLTAAKAEGVEFEEVDIKATDLKATQGEINATKVVGMAQAMASGKTLGGALPVVSSDGYVLDGHHRWAAQWLVGKDKPMRALRVKLPIKSLLDFSDRFSAPKKTFYESVKAAVDGIVQEMLAA